MTEARQQAEARAKIREWLETKDTREFRDGAISSGGYELDYDGLIDLIAEARREENEACAKLVAPPEEHHHPFEHQRVRCLMCSRARAIRERMELKRD